jgi:hypothetical protein
MFSAVVGHRADGSRTYEMEAVSKPVALGAYANQRLNLVANGKAYGRDAETSNRTWEIRPSGIIGGPRETWPWRNCEPPLATERARVYALRLTQTRPSSIPTIGGTREWTTCGSCPKNENAPDSG